MKRTSCAALVALTACRAVTAQVDLSGAWGQRSHEDGLATEATVGDYTGLPINAAAVMRADTWDAAKWTIPEHQCEPHPIDYALYGPASLRIWGEKHPHPESQEIIAWHMTMTWMNSTRTIWMDGRPHPPAIAPHTWMGFSTGRWVGDTLVVTTTHLKEGWLRRNGVPRSDEAKYTEYFMRRGDYMTMFSIIEDPVFLTEPLTRSINWEVELGYQNAPYPCSARVEVERPKGYVAHWLPGENPMLKEFPDRTGIPLEVAKGGAAQMYPEYRDTFEQSARE